MSIQKILSSPTIQTTTSNMEPATIGSLPKEIKLLIFTMLSGQDAAQCSRVCKYWNQLVDDKSLWQSLLRRDYPQVESTESFRALYRGCYLTPSNMINGVYTSTSIDTCHGSISALILVNDQFITGSLYGAIKIWDLNTRECIKTLQASGSQVISLIFTDPNQLISCSIDGTIIVWNLNTRECTPIFQENTCETTSLILANKDQLILGFKDGTIKILDLNSKICTFLSQRYSDEITSFALTKQGELISSSKDCTIKIWDLSTKTLLKILYAYEPLTSLVLTEQEQLVSVSESMQIGAIKIWDLEKSYCITTFAEREVYYTSLIFTHQRLLIAGTQNGTIRIRDLNTGLTKDLRENHTCVTTLALTPQGKLISGHEDGTILFWDFSKLLTKEPFFYDKLKDRLGHYLGSKT